MQDFRTRCLVLLAMFAFVSVMAGCGNRSNNALVAPVHPVTTQSATLNPVLNFYINRSVYTDTTPYTLLGYGVDTVGDFDTYHTGLDTGTTTPPPPARNYQNFYKVLFNFNISALSGATIQSATFRIYQNGVSGTTQNAILENIFYGNTDSFPPAPRDYDNEMGGYIVTPAITASASVDAIGWKSFDVTAKLQADINAGRTNSQFRLSHPNETSLVAFSCDWNLVHNASNKPELVVTYTK